MKAKTWLINILFFLAVSGASPLSAGQKVVVPPKVDDVDDLLKITKKLERYINAQISVLPKFHIQRIVMDSASSLDTEIVMRDSTGEAVRFMSVDEWVGAVQNIGHWTNGVNYAAWNLGSVAPETDSSFRLIRPYANYWDTISFIGIGARRIR